MLNLYQVVSEALTAIVYEDWFNNVGHEEPYFIAELVIARNPGQAKWLAWKLDKHSFTGDITDMPRFSCRKHPDVVAGTEPKIVSELPEYQERWLP